MGGRRAMVSVVENVFTGEIRATVARGAEAVQGDRRKSKNASLRSLRVVLAAMLKAVDAEIAKGKKR